MIDFVVRNLLSNAIKFTDTGGSIEISTLQNEKDVTVTVTDTGIRIPEKILSCLFRIDAQCRQTGTAGEKGTGLGLILCKEFIEKHGSTIQEDFQKRKRL